VTLTVLTAVVGEREAPLVSGLERSPTGVTVVRRCVDVLDLLSAAAAGLARAVVLSADLQRLDRDAVTRLRLAGLAVVGLATPGDRAAAERLTRLGVDPVLAADAPVEEIAQAVAAAVAELSDRNGRPGYPPDHVPGAVGLGDPATALPAPPGPGRPLEPFRARSSGRIVAIWGPAGAPGRTTVAVTLASQLARAGQSTLLVDADTHGASVAQTLGLLDESAGVAAAARAANQGALDLPRLAGLAPPVGPDLRVLTGLPQSRRWPELRASALEVVWEKARTLAAWTIVDAGFGLEADEELMFDTAAPRRHAATLSAITAADVVLAVGSAEPIALQRLIAGLPELTDRAGPGTVRVVVTRVRDGAVGARAGQLITDALQRYAGVDEVVLVPDDRTALDAAMLLGKSLTEHAPGSPACTPFESLARVLIEQYGSVRSGGGRTRRRARWGRRSA
jgi:Mrp family chromosome partitioning ATPase